MTFDEKSCNEFHAHFSRGGAIQAVERFRGIAGKSSLVTDRGGDTRELAYYPLRQLLAFFFAARSFRRIRSPLLSFFPSSLLLFLFLFFYGHQSAAYVDQPRFATCSSKGCLTPVLTAIGSPILTHVLTYSLTHACIHADDRTGSGTRNVVRSTVRLANNGKNPGWSSSTCRRLKSDRIGQRPDDDPHCS